MTRKLKIQFYRDKKREWRWRIKQPNGRITSCSGGDGYKRLSVAVKGLNANYPDCVLVWYFTRSRTIEVCLSHEKHFTVEVIR